MDNWLFTFPFTLTKKYANVIIHTLCRVTKECDFVSKYFDWYEKVNVEELKEVVETIKMGGIIVFPTETVFGIGRKCL